MIIGLTGYTGAGKGTVAEYLKKKGFVYHSCSDILREENKKLGQLNTIENLVTLGNKLREKYGAGILAKRLLEKIKSQDENLSIVDSLRHPEEIAALKQSGAFLLLSVDAPLALRYERIQARQRDEDKITYEEFQKQEEIQISGQGHQVQLLSCIKLADYNLVNDGSFEDLYAKIKAVLEEVGFGQDK